MLGDSYGASVVASLSSKELEGDKHAPIDVLTDDSPGANDIEMQDSENVKNSSIEVIEP